MRDIPKIIREVLEYLFREKKYWLLPVILSIIILWLLLTTAGKSSVPVFVYPMI